ncbi:Hypothetical Protein [Arabidopsis thaliana]|uniref:F13F21.13 protein n=1 Tax=Arabidopsis thaliana TaxID=3702 RepID=Q9XIB0_ARATH|nr:Hypothetical Protein [Arabidopsis thaliana]
MVGFETWQDSVDFDLYSETLFKICHILVHVEFSGRKYSLKWVSALTKMVT